LLQHAGEVVTREDLRRVLWPDGTFVQFDHGLNSCIKQIRAALSDHRLGPRYLETLPRRGYRFIEPLRTEDADDNVSRAQFTLSGTVRVVGGRLHVAIHLTDRADEARVWTTDFVEEIDDVSGSPGRIASRIVDRLVRGKNLEAMATRSGGSAFGAHAARAPRAR
jgi:DNA-binding winged helix-turn-helix (wHTH) protein